MWQKFKKNLVCFIIACLIGGICGLLGWHKGMQERRMAEETDTTMHRISTIESAHNPNAISPAGARGQYQIMRPTWEECTQLMGVNWDYDTDWNDPNKNRAVGEFYYYKRIPAMLKAYKVPDNTETRLACYNGGIGRVKNAYRKDPKNWKQHLPRETREYIVKFASAK